MAHRKPPFPSLAKLLSGSPQPSPPPSLHPYGLLDLMPPPTPSRNELFEKALGKGFEDGLSSIFYSRGEPHVNQPQLPMPDGSTGRPDTVTFGLGRIGPFGLSHLVPETVEEQKDVRTLRPEHIEQAYGYGQAVQPRSGTNVNIPARTDVPLSTLGLASLFGVDVRRWPY